MKRRPWSVLVRLGVFLLAGAVVNVAVAWGLMGWSRPLNHGLVHLTEADRSWLESQNEEASETYAIEVYAHGKIIRIIMLGQPADRSKQFFGTPRPSCRAIMIKTGWPLLCLSMESWVHSHEWCYRNDSPLEYSEIFGQFLVGDHAMPLIPDLNACLMNTVFYAVALRLLFAPARLRRIIRRRRGLCPKCAYPVGVNEVCTECGEHLSTRRGAGLSAAADG